MVDQYRVVVFILCIMLIVLCRQCGKFSNELSDLRRKNERTRNLHQPTLFSSRTRMMSRSIPIGNYESDIPIDNYEPSIPEFRIE